MSFTSSEGRPPSTSPGWYPDQRTGGTQYWDGSRWTGDARPPRKSFAAAADYRVQGWSVILLGFLGIIVSVGAYVDTGESGYILSAILVPLGGAGIGAYLVRGQGPTTEEVEQRLADERKDSRKKRRTANIAGAAATVGRIFAPPPSPVDDNATAAQIHAISDPETAAALQNLQKLLYTRALTDEEYAAAKQRLVGPTTADQFEQIEKLAELHRQGILGDVEFSAAKARVLRL